MTAATLIDEIAELALVVAFLYFALGFYLGWKQPRWAAFAKKRPFTLLLVLVLAVGGIKVGEDVVNKESGPVDTAVLQFLHAKIPSSLDGVFETITATGSANVLVPLAIVIAVALALAKRRLEALLVALSVISGGIVIYLLKALVGRIRPDLWDTEWYWGSSFPSGHTLGVAAFATAVAISARRIGPAAGKVATLIAVVWVFAVGLSRLVLGAHWPTDVLVALCIGMFLPLAISVALESWHA